MVPLVARAREAEKIGKTVERSTATVNEVVRILIENGYFSKDLGSMPLWRYANNKKGMSLTGSQPNQVTQSGLPTGDEDLGNGEDHSSPNGEDGKTEGFSGAFPGISQEVSDRFTAQQREIEGLKRVMDTRFDELKELMTGGRTVTVVNPQSVSGAEEAAGNPVDNPVDGSQVDDPQEEETSMEDRLMRAKVVSLKEKQGWNTSETLEVLLTAYQIFVVNNGREDRFTAAVKTAMKGDRA